MRITILLLVALLAASCSPLRRINRSEKTDSTVVDKTEIRKIVAEVVHEQGTLRQTVVEFYPPEVAHPRIEPSATVPSGPIGNKSATPSTQLSTSAPAIKRIIKTEIATQREQATTTDSTAHNNISTALKVESSDKIVEKPPATVAAIKWIAIGLGALLLIIIVIKFLR